MLGCIVVPFTILVASRVTTTNGLSEGIEVAVFLTGFVLFFVLAFMALLFGLTAIRERRLQRPINGGHYLWAKALTDDQADFIQRQDRAQRRRFLGGFGKVLAAVLAISAVITVLARPEGVSIAQSLGMAVGSAIFLALAIAVIGGLSFWIMKPAGVLTGAHRHVVATDAGLLLEPMFLPWRRMGMSLASVAVASRDGQPTIDFTYSVALRYSGAARKHCYSVPLDEEDIEQATQLANLLQTHCTAAAD